MRLRISHTTTYLYEPPATGVIQILRVTPGSHDGQYVAEWQIDVSTDSRLDVHQDAFGNVTHVLTHGPLADLTINTSKFTVHELRDFIREKFWGGREESKIMVYVTSFGYRHGVPPDSDLVFDVRFLPNPNYIPRFKKLTGRHPSVARYIRSFPQTLEFIERISQLLIYLLPHYIREGKSYLTIAFGCTGGHHRSVMIADQIRKNLSQAGFHTKVTHRDLAKPV